MPGERRAPGAARPLWDRRPCSISEPQSGDPAVEGENIMECSRRALLGILGGLAAGGTLTALAGKSLAAPAPQAGVNGRFAQANGEFGWQPHKLDARESMPIAYEGYWYKGYACGYGAFYGIVGVLGEKYGAPYNQFPFTMLEANKGGISDWGTICGALYGAAAAFALFWPRKDRDAMVNELFRWYESTPLPVYNPGEAAQGFKGDIPASVSDSVLCHISVSKWCHANNKEAAGKERSERCGRLTADVVGKAIEIINAKIDAGKDYKGALPKQESVAYCSDCHAKGKQSDIVKGNMSCTPCHSGGQAVADKFRNHP